MRAFFEGFILSISFFTKLPTPYMVKNITDKTYKYLTLTIPLNGLILATLTIGFYSFLVNFSSHPIYEVTALLASVFYLFLYGFLHLEAVADVIDAYYGSHSGKDVREILKDSHVGALGAIGTFCFILVKVAGLSYLLISEQYLGIFAVLFLSRALIVASIYRFEFHHESKFIEALKKPLDKASMVVFSLFVLFVMFGLGYPLFILAGLLFTYMLQKWLLKYIGFLNGDGLGFIIEMNELLFIYLLIFT
jgi:adenosylcobinamide-GDP ribazoletransferase